MYCDTPNQPDGEAMGRKLQERIRLGFTMHKIDVGIQPLIGTLGALSYPVGFLASGSGKPTAHQIDLDNIQHPFTHVRLTQKGIQIMCEYVAQVRSVVGYEVPIAADHFGHMCVDDCLRLGEALEPYNLA